MDSSTRILGTVSLVMLGLDAIGRYSPLALGSLFLLGLAAFACTRRGAARAPSSPPQRRMHSPPPKPATARVALARAGWDELGPAGELALAAAQELDGASVDDVSACVAACAARGHAVDRWTARRLAVARRGDAAAAAELHEAGCAWRAAHADALADAAALAREDARARFFRSAGDTDRGGRPIVVWNGPAHDPSAAPPDAVAAHAVSVLDRALEAASARLARDNGARAAAAQRVTLVLWLPGGTPFDWAMARAVVGALQTCHPERLHRCLIFPCNMFSHNLWRVASLFVDAGTHRKIVMGTGRAPALFRRHVGDATLARWFGYVDDDDERARDAPTWWLAAERRASHRDEWRRRRAECEAAGEPAPAVGDVVEWTGLEQAAAEEPEMTPVDADARAADEPLRI